MIGEEIDAHPVQRVRGGALAPLVADRLARKRPRDPGLHLRYRVGRHELAERAADQLVDREADPFGERLVREAQSLLAIEMQDRGAHAVGDEPQPMLALDGLLLQSLQVVDIGAGDEHAPDVALGAAVGVAIDADPDRLGAIGLRKLAFEPGRLAAERDVEMLLEMRERLAPEDILGISALDLVGMLAKPIQECLVGKPEAQLAIDVGKRQSQRIELALRQGE